MSVCEFAVTLVGSFITQCRSLTSSRSLRLYAVCRTANLEHKYSGANPVKVVSLAAAFWMSRNAPRKESFLGGALSDIQKTAARETRAKAYKPSWPFQFHAGALDFSILGVQTGNQRLHRSLKMSKHGLLYFVVFEVCSLRLSHSFPKQYCNN